MSPRPRVTTDAQILTAAHRAITRVGPARLTLADVAREAGTSPATLVQRFGSKRGLLLAFASLGPGANRELFAAIRQSHASPTKALLAMADCMAQFAATPEEISNSLAFLQIDLTDPDFHRLALENAYVFDSEIRCLIMDAVKAGELTGCVPARLARVLGSVLHGSLVNWAVYRQGSVRDWIRRDLKTTIAPYRARKRRALRGKKG